MNECDRCRTPLPDDGLEVAGDGGSHQCWDMPANAQFLHLEAVVDITEEEAVLIDQFWNGNMEVLADLFELKTGSRPTIDRNVAE